jgi:hypothetical protein
MKAIEAVKQAAAAAGVPTTHIGRSMGRFDNYVAKIATRGSVPRCDTEAAMLAPCGYALAAVPVDDLPPSALVIDPADPDA